jgi:GDP-mannose 6-dehydrogenase
MSLTLSVFGLGYVGCVSAACFANEGHTVIGVDVNDAKVDLVNRGCATIVEFGIGELVAEMVAKGRLSATTDVHDAVRRSAVSLICVGTPSRPNGSIDLSHIERVCASIGEALRDKRERHTVIIRSTILPGTLETIVAPILERSSGRTVGEDLGVAANPEFLREGTSIRDFLEPPFTLVGTNDAAVAEVARVLYGGLEAPLHVMPPRVAEMVKYACNSFHALKVSFANEIGNICKAQGVDSHDVMRLFCEDTKLNISPSYLKPGFAFGGSCLPKDVRALTYRARQVDVETPVLCAALQSNHRQIEHACEMILATGQRRVGVLGLSFKAGTDDLRESPMVKLIETLIGKGLQLAIYDKDVRDARLIGANREYIEREVPHIWSLMRPSVQDVLDAGDVIVIGNAAAEFRSIEPQLRREQVVVDLVRAFVGRASDGVSYEGICW